MKKDIYISQTGNPIMESETNEPDTPRTLKTSTTTLQVVDVLKELDGATVTELADHLDFSKGAAYNHLVTLRENDYVIKREDTYELSPRFILTGEYVRQENLLYQFGKEEVDELVERTGEYAQLVTEQHGTGIVVYQSLGEKSIGSDYPLHMQKNPLHLHHTSAGKSILAHLPEDRIDEIISQYNLFERTENTITDREKLLDELESVRERGYAYNKEEEVEGLRAVGAPIMAPDGDVLGALSLSGPKSRLRGDRFEEDLPGLVTNAAEIIQVNINMDYSVDKL